MKHTIFLTIGPSQCGKSWFSERLKDQHNAIGKRGTVISSDSLRQEVHGDNINLNYETNSNRMMAMSKAAFELLHTKLKLFTSWPQIQDFVIIDSTGLNADFRKSILDLADSQQYRVVCLMFDYKDKSEYMKHLRGDIGEFVIHKQIKALRTNVLPVLERKRMEIVRVKSFDDHFPVIESLIEKVKKDETAPDERWNPEVQNCVINNDHEYLIVGDIHGCINTFKDLLVKAGFVIENDKIVSHEYGKKVLLCGDLIDKGQHSVETLRFALNNTDFITWVDDNHARFVQHKLSGKETGISEEFTNKYFSSWKEFEKPENRELLDKYIYLSSPFLVINNGDVVVTHSPCPMKYLQKYDSKSRKAQRNWRDYKEQFKTLIDEADFAQPFRVFGHVATTDGIKHKNLIGIDTGACHQDGKLTGIVITKDRKVFYTSVPRNELDAPFIGELKPSRELMGDITHKKFDASLLSGRDRSRIHWAKKQKINFVSGTISPSEATETEFEPIETALKYYKEKGHEQVMLQQKHMGSRAEVYLHSDPELDFATSRSGYPIKGYNDENGNRVEDMKPIFAELRESYVLQEMLKGNKMIVLDCEFMPWSALGKDLIERTFYQYQNLVEGEIKFKEEFGFEAMISQIQTKKDELMKSIKDAGLDYYKTSKHQIIELVKHHGYELIRNTMNYKHTNLGEHIEGIGVFKKQVELYGKAGKPYFRPFALLKTVSDSGVNTIVENQSEHAFQLSVAGFTPTLIINSDDVEQAKDFFNKQVTKGAEGIMVKPLVIDRKSVPAIKVRNEDYLHIIYGHDYRSPEKYAKLCKHKKVFGKQSLSAKEWNIGLNLLEENYDGIPESETFDGKFARAIEAEAQERELDPRL